MSDAECRSVAKNKETKKLTKTSQGLTTNKLTIERSRSGRGRTDGRTDGTTVRENFRKEKEKEKEREADPVSLVSLCRACVRRDDGVAWLSRAYLLPTTYYLV